MAHSEGFLTLLKTGGWVFLAILAAVCVVALYWMLRDSFRFGSNNFPWFVGFMIGIVFGAVGFLAADLPGTAIGAPFLVAFVLGKRAALKKANDSSR